MRRASAVTIVAIAVLAIGIGVSGGSTVIRHGIAYVTRVGGAAEVWLGGPDGRGARRLGAGFSPLISPNGSLVAASSQDPSGPALILYSASGSVAHRFFTTGGATTRAQAWSRDSRYLAVILASTDPASAAGSGLALIDTSNYSYRILARGVIYGASFDPGGSNRIVYASAHWQPLAAAVNVHVVAIDGSGRNQLTHDGRSLNPVWGRYGIAFDRERLRRNAAPVYELWLMAADGTHRTALTRLRVPPLLNGLVPLAFSDDGTKLLAEYEGQNTSRAWTIAITTRRGRELRLAGHSLEGAAISHNGAAVLVDRGGFLNPLGSGVVDEVPFTGGAPITLVPHGSEPSWNL